MSSPRAGSIFLSGEGWLASEVTGLAAEGATGLTGGGGGGASTLLGATRWVNTLVSRERASDQCVRSSQIKAPASASKATFSRMIRRFKTSRLRFLAFREPGAAAPHPQG